MAKKITLTQDLLIPINIGIIGYGIVGQALAYGFSEKSKDKDQISYYDKYKDSLSIKEVVEKSEFIFLTLPTPMKKDESGIDLSIIEENLGEIIKYTGGTDKIIVIKSTVVPGTTREFEKKYPNSLFSFNPEFLTERNYLKDFLEAKETIIGATNDHVLRRLSVIYQQRFPNSKIYLTDPTTAEAVKYFRNTFLSLKVSFANIFYDMCQALGINYQEMKDMAAADPRIVDSHLDVTTVRGFGQKCFPKDLVAIINRMKGLKVDAEVLEEIWAYNKRIRKVYDWLETPFAVEHNTTGGIKDYKPDYEALNTLIYKPKPKTGQS